MKNKLLLSLWLLGAVLYTGSTVFLANAVLGGVGGHADKAKPDDGRGGRRPMPKGEHFRR